MILPDPTGKAWAASGRIASMWLTLVLAMARGTPSRPLPPNLNCRCVLPRPKPGDPNK